MSQQGRVDDIVLKRKFAKKIFKIHMIGLVVRGNVLNNGDNLFCPRLTKDRANKKNNLT